MAPCHHYDVATQRYAADRIYTHVGSILVALNPFKVTRRDVWRDV